jgi:hypothetical protein
MGSEKAVQLTFLGFVDDYAVGDTVVVLLAGLQANGVILDIQEGRDIEWKQHRFFLVDVDGLGERQVREWEILFRSE